MKYVQVHLRLGKSTKIHLFIIGIVKKTFIFKYRCHNWVRFNWIVMKLIVTHNYVFVTCFWEKHLTLISFCKLRIFLTLNGCIQGDARPFSLLDQKQRYYILNLIWKCIKRCSVIKCKKFFLKICFCVISNYNNLLICKRVFENWAKSLLDNSSLIFWFFKPSQ